MELILNQIAENLKSDGRLSPQILKAVKKIINSNDLSCIESLRKLVQHYYPTDYTSQWDIIRVYCCNSNDNVDDGA